MTKLQSWMIAGLGVFALAAGVLISTGALTSAQTDEPTPTPHATDGNGDGTSPTPAPSTSPKSGGEHGCGGGGAYQVKEAAAEVLGISEDELRTQLMSGQTLAQIAEAHGMSTADFKAALKEKITADLQAELDAGNITQEQFNEKTSNLDAKLDSIINSEGGLRFHGRSADSGSGGTGTWFRAPFQREPAGSGT
jgi:hypothetical protein